MELLGTIARLQDQIMEQRSKIESMEAELIESKEMNELFEFQILENKENMEQEYEVRTFHFSLLSKPHYSSDMSSLLVSFLHQRRCTDCFTL